MACEIAGDFSAYDLQNVQVELDQVYRDNHMTDQYKKRTDCFNDVYNSQTIALPERFLNPSDCTNVEIAYLCDDECDPEPIDCTHTGCDIPEGKQLSTETMSLTPPNCMQSDIYEVSELQCQNRFSFQRKVAESMFRQVTQLDYGMMGKWYGALESFADPLTKDGDLLSDIYGLGDVADDIWMIDKSAWTPEIMAKFECLIEDCYFKNPMLLTGSIWREEMKIWAAKNGGGCCDSNSLAMNSTIPIKHETKFFDKNFSNGKCAFLMDTTDLGFYNVYHNPSVNAVANKASGTSGNPIYRWHINSPRLSWRYNRLEGGSSIVPIKYDVYGQWKCLDKRHMKWCWYIEAHCGFLKAPKNGCACPTIIKMEQPCVGC